MPLCRYIHTCLVQYKFLITGFLKAIVKRKYVEANYVEATENKKAY